MRVEDDMRGLPPEIVKDCYLMRCGGGARGAHEPTCEGIRALHVDGAALIELRLFHLHLVRPEQPLPQQRHVPLEVAAALAT